MSTILVVPRVVRMTTRPGSSAVTVPMIWAPRPLHAHSDANTIICKMKFEREKVTCAFSSVMWVTDKGNTTRNSFGVRVPLDP